MAATWEVEHWCKSLCLWCRHLCLLCRLHMRVVSSNVSSSCAVPSDVTGKARSCQLYNTPSALAAYCVCHLSTHTQASAIVKLLTAFITLLRTPRCLPLLSIHLHSSAFITLLRTPRCLPSTSCSLRSSYRCKGTTLARPAGMVTASTAPLISIQVCIFLTPASLLLS